MTKDWAAELGVNEEELQGSHSGDAVLEDVSEISIESVTLEKDASVRLAEQELDFLAGCADPSKFVFTYPLIHKTVWQILQKAAALPKAVTRLALGIPRGRGKTTLIKLFIIYLIIFTDRQFILVIAANENLAVNIISDVMTMLSENNIVKLFGDWRAVSFTNRQDLKKFLFRKRTVILAAIGQGGSIRGLNIENERPDIMIFEDIQTREDAKSQPVSEEIYTWMLATAMKARSPKRCLFIFCGNMYPGPHSILKKLKSNPGWIKFISGGILIDGTSIWPELFPIEDVIEELNNDIASGHPEIFFSEVMNDTEVGINNKIDLSKFKTWPWGEHEIPQGKFIVIDPATGKNKAGSDSVGIGLFEVYDGVPACREVIEERLSPGNTILRALAMALRHKCKVIAVESTAYQATLLYWFTQKAEEFGISGIHFVELHSGSQSKNYRISEMMKSLMSGEIVIHEKLKQTVVYQVVNWNPLKRDNVDNILDLLAYAPKCQELYGHLIATDEEIEMQGQHEAGVSDNNHVI